MTGAVKTGAALRRVGAVLLALVAAGCGGKSSSSTSPSQTPSGFDFGRNDPLKATAFGDSITYGVLEQKRRIVIPILVTGNNYPTLLEDRLQGLDAGWRVVNRGVPGETTRQGVARISSVLTIDRPGYVLIMEGTNDATKDFDTALILGNLEAMVLAVQGNQSIPIIATIPPNFRNHPGAVAIVEEMNVLIRGMAKARGIVLAEIYEGMNDRDLWGQAENRDPLHPNEAGYRKMADIWYDAMRQAVPRGGAPAPSSSGGTTVTSGGGSTAGTPAGDTTTGIAAQRLKGKAARTPKR
jgi:lysophospholipase L1-like esterase